MGVIKLKEYRLKSKLSQRDVASMMKISQPHYWSWEQGQYFPNAKQIVELCKIFKCSPNDLFGFKGVHVVTAEEVF